MKYILNGFTIYTAKILFCLWLIIGANNVYANQSCNRKGEICPDQTPTEVEKPKNSDTTLEEPPVIESPKLEEPVIIESPKLEEPVIIESPVFEKPSYPTCQSSIQERQLTCQDGYIGYITQLQTSSCPDPYGEPIVEPWVETANNCTLSPMNVTNMSSPLNPVSPLNPANMEVPATVTETQPVGQEITVIQTLVDTPQTTQSSESTTSTSQQQETPKGKTLVSGFGIVLSLDILNTPAIQQKQTLNTLLEYQQELPYELKGNQDILLEFITNNAVGVTFDRDTRARWDSLLRYNEVQPSY
jgi:hypothetical protein